MVRAFLACSRRRRSNESDTGIYSLPTDRRISREEGSVVLAMLVCGGRSFSCVGLKMEMKRRRPITYFALDGSGWRFDWFGRYSSNCSWKRGLFGALNYSRKEANNSAAIHARG